MSQASRVRTLGFIGSGENPNRMFLGSYPLASIEGKEGRASIPVLSKYKYAGTMPSFLWNPQKEEAWLNLISDFRNSNVAYQVVTLAGTLLLRSAQEPANLFTHAVTHGRQLHLGRGNLQFWRVSTVQGEVAGPMWLHNQAGSPISLPPEVTLRSPFLLALVWTSQF